MKFLGIEFVRSSELKAIREVVTSQSRALEDIGWVAINKPGIESHQFAKEKYDEMVNRCRTAYIKSPLVAQAIHLTTFYTFGDGVSEPRASHDTDPEVQKIVKKFWNDNENKISLTSPLVQLKLSNKMQYDGEIAFALQVDIDGSVYVRVIDPLSIQDIIYDPIDGMRPLFYKRTVGNKTQYIPDYENGIAYLREENGVQWLALLARLSINDAEVLKNTFMYHVKVNNDILDKRGVPEVYRGLGWVNANGDINGDMASFIRAQAQFAWRKKITGTKGQVDSMRARIQQNTSLTNPSKQAGSTLIENQLVENEAIELKAGSGEFFEIGIRRTLLMVCSAFGIMEHYFGDPSTGNLATATAMELPMLKKFSARQKMWEGIYTDLVNFALNMNLFKTRSGAFEFNEIKNRLILVEGQDYANRAIDIDFPPILKEDVKMMSSALTEAKNNGLVPIETAQRMMLQSLGVNNIDEEMEKEFEEKPEPVLPGFPPGQPPVKESFSDSKKNAVRLADKNRAILSRMNGYLREIAKHYRNLKQDVKTHTITEKDAYGKYAVGITNMEPILRRFKNGMQEAAEKYYPYAIQLAEQYVRTHALKEGKVLEARKPNLILNEQLQWNEGFLATSLIPDIRKKMLKLSEDTFDSAEDGKIHFSEGIETFEHRVASYAGALWTVEERAVRILASESGMKANFVGVSDGDTCDGCEAALSGNPYDVADCPIPGELDCLTKCRHAIQLVGDEALTEADIEILRVAEKHAKHATLDIVDK